MKNLKSTFKLSLSVTMAAVVLSGCHKRTDEKDTFEPFNRTVYSTNRVIDALYIRPISKVYSNVVPKPYKGAIGNFINNLGEVPTMANEILQGKPHKFSNSTARLLINSTLGMFGLFDVASQMGIPRHKEDFGQTLAHWGYKNSAYLVLPILGPSTVRDSIGIFVNRYMTVENYFEPKWRNRYYGTTLVHRRTELQEVEGIVGSAGVDEYSLVKNGYLQRRNFNINDGNGVTNNSYLDEPPE